SYVGAPRTEIDARLAATRLRNILRLNASFSFVTGAIGRLAAAPVAELLAVDQVWLVRALGAGLLGFASVVFIVSGSGTSILRPWSLLISFGDLSWVAGTVAVVALSWLSGEGAILMGLLGLVVLALGVSQLRARVNLNTAADRIGVDLNESPPVEIVALRRPSPVAAEQLWPVMTDHQLYANLALNLKAAEGLTPNGPGFRRSCTDRVGRTWFETCTLWDPERRFDVEIDTSDYPYPLRLMQGSWSVEPTGTESSTVAMTFAFQPTRGLYGRVFVPLMHLTFPPILRRIARGWQKAAATPLGAAKETSG
ncbi:MAG: SRPBCC family protein, partial [Acidimicrobiales bacterium]